MRLGALSNGLKDRFRSRRSIAALIVVVLVVVAGVVFAVVGGSGNIRVRDAMVAGTPEGSTPVKLDTSLYLPDTTPAPAVLLSQGFGGDKHDLDGEARTLADDGFVVLTYTARGFGASGGSIHFASPTYEVNDGKLLLSHLAGMSQVAHKNGKPELAVAGSSYGGGLSLLIAAADHRVGAVAADITWNDLQQALFPNFGGSAPGVFKKLYAGFLFGDAFPQSTSAIIARLGRGGTDDGTAQGTVGCGRFAPDVCRAYEQSAAAGEPTASMRTLMRQASPASVASRIDAPTLLTQGEQDSLFPLSQADANAKQIGAHGTPVCVTWRPGGHDASGLGTSVATSQAAGWFHEVFGGSRITQRQAFQFAVQAGVVSAATGDASQQTLQTSGYPGVAGTPRHTKTMTMSGAGQTISSPAGGTPSVITSIPGLGGISGRFDRALSILPSAPGQTAYFATPPVRGDVLVGGASTVRLTVTSKTASDVTLFAGLHDVSNDGSSVLPSQLVSPLRLTGMKPGVPRTVTVQLPSFVRRIQSGHRLQLTVSSTDFAYAGPSDARTYTITLASKNRSTLTVPTVSGSPISAGHPFGWLIVGAALCLLVGGAVGFVILRRRRVRKPRPDLAEFPISVEKLTKEYSGGYRAVDDVSFRVERGQVVGLLGPNGAGKTSALRVLVGLITPTSGEVYVFGEPVWPGAPVLARLGSFIEGPGFLPHLTGRENLRLYWAATGRDADEAEFATAMDIAGLGASIDRRVRTYSQGMRQRLGIAQAMLGLPEVLVLDEPTNGLDPPQIAEMREVLHDYAATGRTVLISSHLLSEVEQTCTHVVVMHRGKLVAAGSVAEIAGAGGMQLSVDDPAAAARVLETAGIGAQLVPARRALEDVFLGLIGDDDSGGER